MLEGMSELRAFLQSFDDAAGHAYESLTYALDGLDPVSAFQQPAPYAQEEPEEGWPLPGSIAWQLAHLTHCKRYYTQHLERVLSGSDDAPVAQPWTPIETLAGLRAAWQESHDAERSAIARLGPEHLDTIAGNGMTVREFLSMIIRHDIWHASQIAVARRLLQATNQD